MKKPAIPAVASISTPSVSPQGTIIEVRTFALTQAQQRAVTRGLQLGPRAATGAVVNVPRTR
jgi:hypothetical protein